jgi:hypothetical protein
MRVQMTANCLQQLFAASDWLLVSLEQEKMLECLVRHRPTMWSGDQSGKTKASLLQQTMGELRCTERTLF